MGRGAAIAIALVAAAMPAGCARGAAPQPALAGEPCRTPAHPTLPPCDQDLDPTLSCVSRGDTSYCAPTCTPGNDSACQRAFPGGCCAQLDDGTTRCAPIAGCAKAVAPHRPGGSCKRADDCLSTYGPPACIRVGTGPFFCSYGCTTQESCTAYAPTGFCCVQSGPGAYCVTASAAFALGTRCP